MCDKVVRDGMVAVLYSPGYGAGWYTWNPGCGPQILFDPDIVAAIEAKDYQKAEDIAESKYPDAYSGGVKDLTIRWLPVGTEFRVSEYDGSEHIITACDDKAEYVTA